MLGVVENMSGYVCPCCQEVTHLFSRGGGQALATEFQVPFLGSLPIDPLLAQVLEGGDQIISRYQSTESSKRFASIAI